MLDRLVVACYLGDSRLSTVISSSDDYSRDPGRQRGSRGETDKDSTPSHVTSPSQTK